MFVSLGVAVAAIWVSGVIPGSEWLRVPVQDPLHLTHLVRVNAPRSCNIPAPHGCLGNQTVPQVCPIEYLFL